MEAPARIPVCRPFVGAEEAAAAARVIQSAWLSTGPEAHALEEDLAAYFDARVVAVSSASIGLTLALAAHGVSTGDEVIVPAITFTATSNSVLHLGARPIFADIDPNTGLMDPASALEHVSARTKAVMPVDLYGQAVDLDPYLELISRRPDIAIIRDAAQSMGTPGVGGAERVTEVFSFYATKNVTAGEGGAIVTRDQKLAQKLRVLSQRGVTADAYARYARAAAYDVVEIGYKGNLADVLAAICRVQLTKMDEMMDMRRRICERYRTEVAMPTIDWTRPTNWHLYPVFTDERSRIRDALLEAGIGTGIHFECVPGHLAYRRLGYDPADTPSAQAFGSRELTLPTFAGLDAPAQDRVIKALEGVSDKYTRELASS